MSKDKNNHVLSESEFKLVVQVFTLLAHWRDDERRKMRSQRDAQVDCSNSKINSQSVKVNGKPTISDRSEPEHEAQPQKSERE